MKRREFITLIGGAVAKRDLFASNANELTHHSL